MVDLRVAIAGAGFIGAVHARSVRLAGARLIGMSASTPARAAKAARTHGAERGFASSEELVTAEDVDVVHICTPNHLHLPLAAAALAAGKHVVCEKPLALDRAGAEQLAAAAAAAGTVAAVPFVYRYYPTVREARERVTGGATGPVHLIHGCYLQDWLLRPEDDNWRVDPELGGVSRAFADIGSHWCDLVQFVSGHRITRVCARVTTVVAERHRATAQHAFTTGSEGGPPRPVSTEDAAVLQFETDRGALGAAVISQVSAGRKNRLWFEIDGAESSVAFNQERPEALWCGSRGATTILHRDPQHLSASARRVTALPAGHPEGYAHCFEHFVADVYAAVVDGRAPDGLPTFVDGVHAAFLTEAVLRSSRDGGWVTIDAPQPRRGPQDRRRPPAF